MVEYENFDANKGLLYAEVYEKLFDKLLEEGWKARDIRAFIKTQERRMRRFNEDFSFVLDSDVTKILTSTIDENSDE